MVIGIVPSTNYAAGTHLVPALTIPANLSRVTFTLTRTSWVANLTLAISMEISLDNGANWQFWFGCTTEGGAILNPLGQAQETTSISRNIPASGNPDRQIRGSVIANASFVTAITLEAD